MHKPKCLKRRFRDSKGANFTLHRLQNTSERDKVPTRSYYCVHCKGWHLTSQTDTNRKETNYTYEHRSI